MTINIRLIRTKRPHWGAYSGINQYLKYINHGAYNIDVYIASDNDDDFPIHNKLIQKWLRRIVQRNGMQYYKLSDLVAEVKTFGKCWRDQIDIIHYMDGEHSAQYLPWLFKQWRRPKTKTIATFHQPPELLHSLTSKRAISHLDHAIVVSAEQIPYFREILPPDKISLILHGINIDRFKPGIKEEEKKKFRCITVGHWLRDFKTLRLVAEKLSGYEDIEFHVVVSNRTGPKQTGLEDQKNIIQYRDTVEDERLIELYQQSDILFLPLLQSTANNALLEGIACGLPVVSTSLPSIKAYVTDKESILIKDNDPHQFIDAILYLVNNPANRKTMAIDARKRAEELDWRNIAPQYEAVYSKIIHN